MTFDEDPLDQLKALKSASVDPLDELKKLKKPKSKQPSKLDVAKRNAAMPHPEDLEDPDPSYAQEALGGVAALARDIPGAEALQAGARSIFRRQPYTEALSDIRGAEEAAPAIVRRGNRVIGAMVGTAAAPGRSMIKQGAAYGGALGLLKADPVGGEDRVKSAVVEGTIGAVAPKVAQGIGTAFRPIFASTLGKVAIARKAAMEAADRIAYGRAALEGDLAAANPMPPTVASTLSEPDIHPYVAEVRASRTMRGANEPAVMRKTYELLTDRQKALKRQTIGSDDYKAGSELEKSDIAAAKRVLLNTADQVMPSFRPAVYQHARAEGEREAFTSAADVTKRIVTGNSGAGKNLESKTPEAFMDEIQRMTPEQAQAALEGVLGRLKETGGLSGVSLGLSANPVQGFGIGRAISRMKNPVAYLEALDRQAAGAGRSRLKPSDFSRILGTFGIGASAPLTR